MAERVVDGNMTTRHFTRQETCEYYLELEDFDDSVVSKYVVGE
jgi:hypothetical protein